MRLESALGCLPNARRDVVTHQMSVHKSSTQITSCLNMIQRNFPLCTYTYVPILYSACNCYILGHLKNIQSVAPI